MIRRTHSGSSSNADGYGSGNSRFEVLHGRPAGVVGSAAYTPRSEHDYGYGSSRASLRPVVPKGA